MSNQGYTYSSGNVGNANQEQFQHPEACGCVGTGWQAVVCDCAGGWKSFCEQCNGSSILWQPCPNRMAEQAAPQTPNIPRADSGSNNDNNNGSGSGGGSGSGNGKRAKSRRESKHSNHKKGREERT